MFEVFLHKKGVENGTYLSMFGKFQKRSTQILEYVRGHYLTILEELKRKQKNICILKNKNIKNEPRVVAVFRALLDPVFGLCSGLQEDGSLPNGLPEDRSMPIGFPENASRKACLLEEVKIIS